MGTTFANLQIHNISINDAEKLAPGSLIKQFNPHWITITSENFEAGNIEQIVRKISKQIESAVLSVEVYDDDTREKKSLSLYDYKGRLITETKLPREAGYPFLLIDNSNP